MTLNNNPKISEMRSQDLDECANITNGPQIMSNELQNNNLNSEVVIDGTKNYRDADHCNNANGHVSIKEEQDFGQDSVSNESMSSMFVNVNGDDQDSDSDSSADEFYFQIVGEESVGLVIDDCDDQMTLNECQICLKSKVMGLIDRAADRCNSANGHVSIGRVLDFGLDSTSNESISSMSSAYVNGNGSDQDSGTRGSPETEFPLQTANEESVSPTVNGIEATGEITLQSDFTIHTVPTENGSSVSPVNSNQLVPLQQPSPESNSSDDNLRVQSGSCTPTEPMLYVFEIFSRDCGRMIGKNGRFVKSLKCRFDVEVIIGDHPMYFNRKICSVLGTKEQIEKALDSIKDRFPADQFPHFNTAQVNLMSISAPCALQLTFPDGVYFETVLSSLVHVGRLFLHQPTHPTYHQLPPLTAAMTHLYTSRETPVLEQAMPGNICVAMYNDACYRVEIVGIPQGSEDCQVKFLDYGGYAILPRSAIRQINCQFMTIPFQSTECLLAGVIPMGGAWSPAALAAFEGMAKGRILHGYVVGYNSSNLPMVNLHSFPDLGCTSINEEMVRLGFAIGRTT